MLHVCHLMLYFASCNQKKNDIADIVTRLLLVEDNVFWLLSVTDMIQSDTKQRCQIIIK